MQLFCRITSLSGKRVPLILADDETTNNTMTPTQLRSKVSAVTKIPLKDLRLIFRGRMIKDDDTIESVLNEYKLENDSVLHCMGKPTIENNNNHSTFATATTSAVPSLSGASITSSTRTVVPPLSMSRTTNVSSASAATAGIPRTIPAMNLNDPLNKSLLRLRQNNPPSVYATGVATLGKVLKNITDHPLEEKYRQVKKQNAAFRKRLGGLVGGHDCMLATGFIVENDSGGGEEVYKLHATAEKWTYLTTTAQRIVADASQQAKLRQQQQSHQPSPAGITTASTASGNGNASAAGSGGGFGGFPSGGMNMNMNDPNVQNMMSQVMNNPESLSATLQNPMVQQMMRNNPDISPSMRQDMETLSNNPAALQQITQRMQDPAVQAQMRQAMSAAGNGNAGGGMGGGMGGMGNMMMPNNNATGAAPVQQQRQRGNDSNQTEDEMIAEAIRRSLEDNM